MLSTEGLKTYIYKEIVSRLGEVSFKGIYFEEGKKGSAEGVYIFAKNNGYHVLYTERGQIQKERISLDEREILWEVLANVSIPIIRKYAVRNRQNGKDFRRARFFKSLRYIQRLEKILDCENKEK